MGVFQQLASLVRQPRLEPLPSGYDLYGRTAIVTGASAGLGLETSRQLLILNLSTLILAVRNVTKGEACKKDLLVDRTVQAHNPKAIVKVMKLDMDDDQSIVDFAKIVKADVPILDFLVLNAGIGLLKFELSPNKHERTMQVNYLSNTLLIFELLPLLESSAAVTGRSTRITWVGSRAHHTTSLQKQDPVKPDETVLGHMDAKEHFSAFTKYNDTKLLCAMFMYELAPYLKKSNVQINMLCPGMVKTAMTDILPIYICFPMSVFQSVTARTVEEGAWPIMNAIVVAGPDSHGKFILDKDIQPVDRFIQSDTGKEIQKKLWVETLKDREKLTRIPPEMMSSL
ncbi:hypothetical protein MMC18_007666 [Xylographa bjoerkii]|nr:hypothetical protein [Xylographa bjoerkii]